MVFDVVRSRATETGMVPNADVPLGRDAWIDAAMSLLVREGVEAVKITRLAEILGVTRGSFYWHFRDRGELLQALIRGWQGKNTQVIVAVAEEAAGLAHGILALFDCWLDARRFDPGLDSAMRDWARRSPQVKRAVKRADDRRLAAIAGLFQRAKYDKTEAFIRARILYFTQVGYYALEIRESMARRFAYLESYYRGFTGRDLDPALAAAHREKHGQATRRRGRSGKGEGKKG